MMYCEKCGNQMTDDQRFCGKCGGRPVIGKKITKRNTPSKEILRAVCSPNEQVIATLGNGYGVNLLFGEAKKSQVMLTDKRIYFQGTFLNKIGNNFVSQECSKVIDLEDVTGTGFLYSKNMWFVYSLIVCAGAISGASLVNGEFMAFMAGALFGGLIALIPCLTHYLLTRKTYFVIEYAGGAIQLDASIVGIADVNDFHLQLRRTKDKRKGN